MNGGLVNSGAFSAQGILNGTITNNAGGAFTVTGPLIGNGDLTNSGTLDVGSNSFTGLSSLGNTSSGNITMLGGTLGAAAILNGGTLNAGGASTLQGTVINQASGIISSYRQILVTA